MSGSKDATAQAKMDIQPLSLRLENENTTVVVDGKLKITFRRTIKVPDNDQSTYLPPDLGAFKLTNVYHAGNLSDAVKVQGGILLPMYQNEGMWIKFTALTEKSYAVKIICDGINAITGETEIDTKVKKQRELVLLAEGKSVQDYIVVPAQPWLDKFSTSPGEVQQFTPTAVSEGEAVGTQTTRMENIRGLQFEITPEVSPRTPSRKTAKVPFEINIRTIFREIIKVQVLPSWEVERVSKAIEDLVDMPLHQQRFIFSGKQLCSISTLSHYGITDGSMLYLVPGMGGGHGYKPCRPISQMIRPIDAGKMIFRVFAKVHKATYSWDSSQTIGFNVLIVNSEHYHSLTGLPNPNSPVAPETYLAHSDVISDSTKNEANTHGDLVGMEAASKLTAENNDLLEPQTKKRRLITESSKLSIGKRAKLGNQTETLQHLTQSPEGYWGYMASTKPSDIQQYPYELTNFKSVSELEKELKTVNLEDYDA
ncbi:hypothetical protein TWF281_002406 [Arthrobotrys megalospora]